MEYTPLTPFRRAIDAVPKELSAQPKVEQIPIDKWQLLKSLAVARAAFGLTDRDLTVLQALLSFSPGSLLATDAGLVVFPSNRTLCERLNDMPCSTMRRHLARLVDTGLIRRRDSPNGKRYLRREGTERTAFGLDLAPLLYRAEEITIAADAARMAAASLRSLRETASLMRRDVASLAAIGEAAHPDAVVWQEAAMLAETTARTLRRKVSPETLCDLVAQLRLMLDKIQGYLAPTLAEKTSTCDAQNEHHQQRTNKEIKKESETEKLAVAVETGHTEASQRIKSLRELIETDRRGINLVNNVLEAYPEINSYTQIAICDWQDLSKVAKSVAPMMGIPPSVFFEAELIMGGKMASVAIAFMLERFSSIRSPISYLRALARRSVDGRFSLAPIQGRWLH